MSFSVVVFLLLCVNVFKTESVLTYEITSDTDEELTTCLLELISTQLETGSILTIINTNEEKVALKHIHNLESMQVLYLNASQLRKQEHKVYVIVAHNDNILMDILDRMRIDAFWRPEAKFIIVSTHGTNSTNLFHKLWEYNVFRVLVVMKSEGMFRIQTYYPFAMGSCGHFQKPVILTECNHLEGTNELFVKDQNMVLKKCKLRAMAQHSPPMVIAPWKSRKMKSVGGEQAVLNLLAEIENFTIEYHYDAVSKNSGSVSKNSTVNGFLELLRSKKGELALGGFFLASDRATVFTYIWSHFPLLDTLHLIVPDPGLVERWRIIYVTFDLSVWVSLFISFVVCTLFAIKLASNNSGRADKVYLALSLWGSVLQNTCHLSKVIKRRAFLSVWLCFIFLMNSFYQTSLISLVTKQAKNIPINDISELKLTRLRPCISNNTRTHFRHNEQQIINDDIRQDVGCDDGFAFVQAFLKGKHLYTIMPRSKFYFMCFKENRDKYLVVKKPLHHLMYAIYFNRGFPGVRRFNRQIMNINQAGIIWKMLKDVHSEFELKKVKIFTAFAKIKLDDLFLPFVFLSVSYAISIIVLLFELYYVKVRA